MAPFSYNLFLERPCARVSRGRLDDNQITVEWRPGFFVCFSSCAKHSLVPLVQVAANAEMAAMSFSLGRRRIRDTFFLFVFAFGQVADEAIGHKAGDLVFIIETLPHPDFTRRNDDLHMDMDILLIAALVSPLRTSVAVPNVVVR